MFIYQRVCFPETKKRGSFVAQRIPWCWKFPACREASSTVMARWPEILKHQSTGLRFTDCGNPSKRIGQV